MLGIEFDGYVEITVGSIVLASAAAKEVGTLDQWLGYSPFGHALKDFVHVHQGDSAPVEDKDANRILIVTSSYLCPVMQVGTLLCLAELEAKRLVQCHRRWIWNIHDKRNAVGS